jgi:pilus assembly protein CpaE
MIRFACRLLKDLGGQSAVEFALIAPVLVVGLVGAVDLGFNLYQRSDLESAVRSGAQYFMNGGKEVDTAVSIVDAAWTNRPEGAVVQSSKFCMCGETISVCNRLCSDKSYPVSYHRISAVVTFEGIISDTEYETSQVVRVR